ncbi:MAG TPA: DNA ligase D [Pirellulaceae bacterium]|jgi:bifunctional non-homologous end joining protein LigD
MGLREYHKKRDFTRTREPRGMVAPGHKQPIFVIQKHAASHLHYDFRLELDGVLKSWAVPKGPDTDPSQKRLAMQVEDHPLEYGDFEGVIPQGEYGGGAVMLWDRGTWESLDDAKKGYREGRLKFTLHGEKLHGRWMLVRKGGHSAAPDERHWFLFKERDQYAGGQRSITERLPLSVATGRGLDEIAKDADRVWGSNGEVKTKKRRSNAKGAVAKRVAKRAMAKKTAASRDAGTNSTEVSKVRLSNPNKVFYPEQGLTKLDLANYYVQVAPWMLPHVVNRPLALVRCPNGCGKPCFFQKHPSEGGPTHLKPVNVSETGSPEINMVIKDAAGLIELVQMGVLEIHIWGSQAKSLEKPDRLIFDLDPDPAVEWPKVVTAAREVKLVLEELGLVTFLKTTGGKGLHLVVPVQPRTEWDEAKAFCKAVADLIVRAAPDRFIATMSKAARKGKIFIDYLRNGRGATAIAPYSTRAKDGAPVSVPIAWNELSPKLRSDQFTIENLFARLDKLKSDSWADIAQVKQSITKAMFKQLHVR